MNDEILDSTQASCRASGSDDLKQAVVVDAEEWCRRKQEDRRVRQEIRMATIFPKLAELGVAKVEVSYRGYEDDGGVEDIRYMDANDNDMTLDGDSVFEDRERRTELQRLLEDAICYALPSGWEINEGSAGSVIINVAERKLAFDHTTYVETTDQWEEVWPIPTTTP